MRIIFLPHALEQMAERGISEEEVRETLRLADVEYSGNRGRRVAERHPEGRRLSIKVVYNFGSIEGDERIVVTVMRGRPSPYLEQVRERRGRSGE